MPLKLVTLAAGFSVDDTSHTPPRCVACFVKREDAEEYVRVRNSRVPALACHVVEDLDGNRKVVPLASLATTLPDWPYTVASFANPEDAVRFVGAAGRAEAVALGRFEPTPAETAIEVMAAFVAEHDAATADPKIRRLRLETWIDRMRAVVGLTDAERAAVAS